jgi:hypothetical protein
MAVHDWTRVPAGIFHHFHHDWITEIARALNRGILPADYYALAEQFAAGFGPDVLTLQGPGDGKGDGSAEAAPPSGGGVLVAVPQLVPSAETDMAFYRRKQSSVAVHHVSGDRIVAVVEVVSPGNKASRNALRRLVEKAAELLEQGIHLLVLDLLPPGRRDPQGIHAAIWEEITGHEEAPPPAKPLTLASYASGLSVRAYVVPVAVGDILTDMPVFLELKTAVKVPLEPTYQAAFSDVPRRWRDVLLAPQR